MSTIDHEFYPGDERPALYEDPVRCRKCGCACPCPCDCLCPECECGEDLDARPV